MSSTGQKKETPLSHNILDDPSYRKCNHGNKIKVRKLQQQGQKRFFTWHLANLYCIIEALFIYLLMGQ